MEGNGTTRAAKSRGGGETFMDLINGHVTHRMFGKGSISSMREGKITVDFNSETGSKMFQYPLAFDTHLTMDDAKLQPAVAADLERMHRQIEAQRERDEQARVEDLKRQAVEAAKHRSLSSRGHSTTRKSAAGPTRETTL